MNPHMTPAEISGFLERTLLRVQKPARYPGGEWNSIAKEWDATVQPGRWTARLSSPKTPAPDARTGTAWRFRFTNP